MLLFNNPSTIGFIQKNEAINYKKGILFDSSASAKVRHIQIKYLVFNFRIVTCEENLFTK